MHKVVGLCFKEFDVSLTRDPVYDLRTRAEVLQREGNLTRGHQCVSLELLCCPAGVRSGAPWPLLFQPLVTHRPLHECKHHSVLLCSGPKEQKVWSLVCGA